jgi:hypothetical protein
MKDIPVNTKAVQLYLDKLAVSTSTNQKITHLHPVLFVAVKLYIKILALWGWQLKGMSTEYGLQYMSIIPSSKEVWLDIQL